MAESADMAERAVGFRSVMGRWHGRRGITLVECLIALTILPLAVAAVAFAVVSGQQQSLEALRQERAAALGEALMEEILARPFDDPQGATGIGPDVGEPSRAAFDNMDDYHGHAEASGGVRDAAQSLYPTEFQTFSRSVSCSLGSQTLLGSTPTGLHISVIVSDAKGSVLSLTRFVPEP